MKKPDVITIQTNDGDVVTGADQGRVAPDAFSSIVGAAFGDCSRSEEREVKVNGETYRGKVVTPKE